MTISGPTNPASPSLTRDVLYALRYYLGGRTGLIAVAAVALGLGAYSNWGWLAAAGIAPLLLTLAPCAVMCALGLCMGRGSKSPADSRAPQSDPALEVDQSPTARVAADEKEANEQDKVTSRNRKDCC